MANVRIVKPRRIAPPTQPRKGEQIPIYRSPGSSGAETFECMWDYDNIAISGSSGYNLTNLEREQQDPAGDIAENTVTTDDYLQFTAATWSMVTITWQGTARYTAQSSETGYLDLSIDYWNGSTWVQTGITRRLRAEDIGQVESTHSWCMTFHSETASGNGLGDFDFNDGGTNRCRFGMRINNVSGINFAVHDGEVVVRGKKA